MLSFLKTPRRQRRIRRVVHAPATGLAKTRQQLGQGSRRPVRRGPQARRSVLRGTRNHAASRRRRRRRHRLSDRDVCAPRARRERYTEAARAHGRRCAPRCSSCCKPIARRSTSARTSPFVIMLAGVNGAGKTTSIGKLAHYYQQQGKSVLLAAGDTFRAAAREQLQAWGERNNVTVIAQQSGDAAAVIFDAINAARARGIDIVLADTAGRLPTQLHLMEEIRKVKRVIAKAAARRAARSAAGARRQHRPERADPGQGVRRRARRHRPGADQARRHRQGRRDLPRLPICAPAARNASRFRCASSASAKASTICGRSTPKTSSMRCLIEAD